jgi:hypothetical protein
VKLSKIVIAALVVTTSLVIVNDAQAMPADPGQQVADLQTDSWRCEVTAAFPGLPATSLSQWITMPRHLAEATVDRTITTRDGLVRAHVEGGPARLSMRLELSTDDGASWSETYNAVCTR